MNRNYCRDIKCIVQEELDYYIKIGKLATAGDKEKLHCFKCDAFKFYYWEKGDMSV